MPPQQTMPAVQSEAVVTIDGQAHRIPAGTMLAAALWSNGPIGTRSSSRDGSPRAALCGMGTCQECRVQVEGLGVVRACTIACSDGMTVQTGVGR